jgi:hypothetical protein
MSFVKGPEYYVTSNTSAVLIDSTLIPLGSTAVVYLSTIRESGRVVSIRDVGGYLNSTTYITLSTSQNNLFRDGTSNFTFNTPYGYANCTNFTSSIWALTNVYSYPIGSTFLTSINAGELNASTINCRDITAQTITLSSFATTGVDAVSSFYLANVNVSTINSSAYPIRDFGSIFTSTLRFANGTSPYKTFGTGTLVGGTLTITNNYVTTSPDVLIFITRTTFGLPTSGSLGQLIVTKNNGSFTVNSLLEDGSLSTLDISSFTWIIFNPSLS